MKNMKKRVMACFMTLLMVLSLLPTNLGVVNVSAEEAETSVATETETPAATDTLAEGMTEATNTIGANEVTYEFTPSDITTNDTIVDGDTYIKDGTYETVFALDGNNSNKWRLKSGFIDGGKSSNCKLTYTVSPGTTGTFTFVGRSNVTSASGTCQLVDKNGQAVANTASAISVTMANEDVTSTYENLTPEGGPYTLQFTSGKCRYTSFTAVETGSAPATGTAPVIATATATQNATDPSSVTVSWTASTAATGDGKTVIARSKDGGDFEEITTLDATETATSYVDTLTASGTYTYKVYGKLGTTTNAGATTGTVSYTLPLATPVVSKAQGEDQCVILTWGAVAEADSYTVKVYEGDTELTGKTATGITGTTCTITGLTNGTEYGFVVVANRTAMNETASSEMVRAAAQNIILSINGLDASDLTASTLKSEENVDASTLLVSSPRSTYAGTWNILANGKTVTIKADEALYGDVKFTQSIQLGGTGNNTQRAITLTITEPSYVILYANHGGGSGTMRTLRIEDANGEVIKDISVASKNDSYAASSGVNLTEAGTYYIYSTGSGINVHGIVYGLGTAPKKDWNKVEAPVIKSVEDNGNGTFTVNFDAVFGDEGGEKAYVFAYQNGFEVSNAEVISGDTAVLSAKNDGDYTFKMVLMRSGEADKESNVVSYTNYELPLEKPYITWVNNLGDGSVYVDWNNITADSFDVMYKAEGDSDFTTAVEGNTTGNYTITGLTAGTTYTIRVLAHNSIKGDSYDDDTITVGDPSQQWYAAVFGSATSSTMTIGGTEYSLKSGADEYADGTPVADVTGTDQTISIARSNNGKVADSEDGIQIYYTKINPNTENFKLSATFTVTDDYYVNNQSGYGIYAMDIKGVGSKDAKYFNSVAVGQYKFFGGTYHSNGVRRVTGYTTYNPTSTAGTGRILENTQKFATQSTDDHSSNGDTFTYTLEKTNAGFNLSMNGETITLDDASTIMVQEDGSIIIGVMAARVGVEISNITFEKTEGGIDKVETVSEVTPALTIYSTDKVGTQSYEFIAKPNVKGWLIVTVNGEKLYDSAVEAEKVVRVPMSLWNEGGNNTFTYEFDIDESTPDLTNYGYYKEDYTVLWQTYGTIGETIYVSPDGNEGGDGTRENPLDLQTALYYAQPGQYIVMMDGTYYPTKDYIIPRSQGAATTNTIHNGLSVAANEVSNYIGAADGVMITLMAEHTGKAIIDGSQIDTSEKASAANLSLVGSYWRIYGIQFTNAKGVGMRVNGNYNVVEMCTFDHNANSGLQISRYSSEPNDNNMWPTNNLIKNCDAYDNCDPGRSDADGFAAKLTCGDGNKFYGCISHHNIDDGWDLYAKSTTGPIGVVTIENCVTYNNGWLSTDDPSQMGADDFGEGNGFKMGGENMPGAHQLINSVSYDNYAKGVTSNSGPDIGLTNITVFNNSLSGSAYNVSLYTKTANEHAWTADGVLSVVDTSNPTDKGATTGYPKAELGASNGVMNSLRSATNYFYDGAQSLNTQSVAATSDWFISVDVVNITPTRNEDGSINMHGLLVLKDSAPTDTGARLVTTGEALSVAPVPGLVVSYKMVATFTSFISTVSGGSSVKTGDATPVVPMAILFVASFAVCAGMVVSSRKRRNVR